MKNPKKYKVMIVGDGMPKQPFKHAGRVISKEEIMTNRCNAYEFLDFDEKGIEEQVKLTEKRGERVFKYLDAYKGQNIYNEIALAIEFGYQLKSEEYE